MNAEEYRKLAAVEDRMWYFRALHAHIERALRANLGGRSAAILDAGCGTGGLMARLGPRHANWRWTGIDLEDLACELARARLGSAISVQRGSVTSLPYPDSGFDAVVSADVLYHLDDDAAALREFHRVLRPGGTVILNVPAYRWLWSYHDRAVHSRRRYVRAEVEAKLISAAFAISESTYWNAVLLPLIAGRRKLWPAPASGSDVKLYPPWVEKALDVAMAAERGWLRAIGRLPFGSSVFAVGRRL